MRLRIRHESTYSYAEPVEFGLWRLLMRPLDTHATRLIEASLETPPSRIKWSYDAYGNCVCHLKPDLPSDHLTVVNNLVVDRYPSPLAAVDIDNPCSMAPIVYNMTDRAILEPFIAPAAGDDDAVYRGWLRAQLTTGEEPAIVFLQRLNSAIHDQFGYRAREEEGTQSPGETVRFNSGTCRDFAWLMIESVRRLGFAARFATGYLYTPGSTVRGAGATHAWCEVFLPDLGWTEFDPTNGLVESSNLIRVATTRTWRAYFMLLSSAVADAGALRAIFAAAHARVERRLEAWVLRGQAEGAIRREIDADAVALMIGSLLFGVSMQLLIDPAMNLDPIRQTSLTTLRLSFAANGPAGETRGADE
jgi:transglutaminase-like putative cysteine protease